MRAEKQAQPSSDRARRLTKKTLAAGGVVTTLAVVGSFAGIGAATAAESDIAEAEGRVLTFSGGTVNVDQLAALESAYSANGGSPEAVNSPLSLELLSGLNIDLGVGLGALFADGTNDGVLGVGALGQFAEANADRVYASSGAVGDAGAIAIGGTDPADSAYLDLGNLLGAVGTELGIGDITGTLISDLRLDLGAISASAEIGDDGVPVGDYQIADGQLVITSPAVSGLADRINQVAGGLSEQLNGAFGADGALNTALTGATDALNALTSAINAIPLVTLDEIGVTATADVDLSNALASLLQEQLTSDDSALTIDISEGTISVDLAKLVQDTQGGDFDGTLNNLPENTEILSPDTVQAILDGTAGTLLDEIPGRAYDLIMDALESVDLNVALTGGLTVGLPPLAVEGDLDVQINGTVGDLLNGNSDAFEIDASGTQIAGLELGLLVNAITTPIKNTLLPAVSSALSTVLSDVGLTDSVFRAPVEAVNALLTPITDVLNNVVSLTANVKETPGSFTHENATTTEDTFTQRALELSLLPLGDEPLVSLALASATVRGVVDEAPYVTAITVTPETIAQGEKATIEGTGFEPGETVTITVGDDVVGTTEANDDGSISYEYTTTEETATGTFDVIATGEVSNVPANGSLEITDGDAGADPDTDTNGDVDVNGTPDTDTNGDVDVNGTP
ncbi:choice-of-anchor G family protein, partial [Microbacterium gubbeenense]|uniref:choice-of-anchor G family protein n=1 Tax=Microbacterium gubbeenense TaxID=159896 RepID=UPI003F99ED8A